MVCCAASGEPLIFIMDFQAWWVLLLLKSNHTQIPLVALQEQDR